MMNEFALLEDGFSITTTIPRVPGLHPAVTVRFRPALAEERHAYLMLSERDMSGKDRVTRQTELIHKHLESWDIRSRTGTEPPRTPENIRRLQPSLQAKMLDLILGYSPATEDEDAKNSSPASTS